MSTFVANSRFKNSTATICSTEAFPKLMGTRLVERLFSIDDSYQLSGPVNDELVLERSCSLELTHPNFRTVCLGKQLSDKNNVIIIYSIDKSKQCTIFANDRHDSNLSAAIAIHGSFFGHQEKWAKHRLRLVGLSNLKQGWNGKAEAPNTEAIKRAQAVLNVSQRLDLCPERVSPSSVGGIGITFRRKPYKVYLELLNTGTILSLYSDGETEPQVRCWSLGETTFEKIVVAAKAYLDDPNTSSHETGRAWL
jgi:hypothetical protein